jgi:LPS O-antigen subunit length determinant protein (WzzB/FepE family)
MSLEQTDALDGRETNLTALLDLRERLALDMQDAINDGLAHDLIRIDAHVRSLNHQIFAAEVQSVKDSITGNESRRDELAEKLAALRELKTERAEKFMQAARVADKLKADVGRAEVAVQLAENQLLSARLGIKALRAKLDDLKAKKLREIELNGIGKNV